MAVRLHSSPRMLGAASLATALVVGGSSILGGAPAPDHPETVALVIDHSVPYCTGTLIAPDRVLTAGHCLFPDGAGLLPPTHVVVVAVDGERRVPVAWTALAAGFDRSSLTADLAVLALAAPIVDVAPAQLSTRALGPNDVGRTTTWIGFGFDRPGPSGTLGVRHLAEVALAVLEPQRIVAAPVSCNGDSGGPVMIDDGASLRLIGVVSAGGPGCQLYSKATRVDVLADWIAQMVSGPAATCGRDQACTHGCAVIDPDCACPADGVCGPCVIAGGDPDCVAVGGSCRTSDDCGGVCVDGLCRQACPTDVCTGDTTCIPDDHYGRYCAPAGGCQLGTSPGGLLVLAPALFLLGRVRRRAQP